MTLEQHWEERSNETNNPQPAGKETNVLVDFVKRLQPKKVLEVGCNYGRELKCLEGLAKLYGIDSNKKMINHAKLYVNGEFRVADASSIPFGDNHFDLVYTDGLLSHISPEKVEHTLKDIERVSKKFILFIEYMGTQRSANSISNCKTFTWIHDYEKLIALLNVFIKYNKRIMFGADCYQFILMEKHFTPKKETIIIEKPSKPRFRGIRLGKFKIGWES